MNEDVPCCSWSGETRKMGMVLQFMSLTNNQEPYSEWAAQRDVAPVRDTLTQKRLLCFLSPTRSFPQNLP